MCLEIELKFVAVPPVGQTFPSVLFLSLLQSREPMSSLQQSCQEKSPIAMFFIPTCWYQSWSSPRCPLELLFSLRSWK